MLKVITNTKTRVYYEKGDMVKYIPTGDVIEVGKIVNEGGKTTLITPHGAEFTLTPDFKPTEETVKKCTIMDRSKPTKIQPKKDIVYFAKVREDAIIPSKVDENGAYDVYANFEGESITILPQTVALIGTGICSAFEPKYRCILKERGSTGTKLMEVRAGVIDSGFRGEWKVAISNGGRRDIIISKTATEVEEKAFSIIYPYAKAICQADLEEVPTVMIKEISLEELKAIPSKRGEGMLGASGK